MNNDLSVAWMCRQVKVTGNNPFSSQTDVSAIVTFTLTLPYLVIKSPIRIVSGSAGVELPVFIRTLLFSSVELAMFLLVFGLGVVAGHFCQP